MPPRSNLSSSTVFKSVSTCVHITKFPRHNAGSPIVNRCDGDRFHLGLISGPRLSVVLVGGRLSKQIVCGFAYFKDQRRGYVTVLMRPAKKDSFGRERIEEATDQLVCLIQNGAVRTAYRLDDSLGLIAEEA